MTADENEKIARLTTNAVNHPSDVTVESILDLIAKAEQRSTEVREIGERIITEFRKHAGLLSDQVNDHFAKCQAVTDALRTLGDKLFGEDFTSPPVNNGSKLDSAVTDAVARALDGGRSLIAKGQRSED